MNKTFDTLFFDLGGTLRLLYDAPAHQEAAIQKVAKMVGTDMEPHAFAKLLDERYEVYRRVCFEQMWEATEPELWTRYMLPDFDRGMVIKNAVDLSYEYRQFTGIRHMAPHSKETVIELHRRGYRLGIISNLITSQEVPDWLAEEGLTELFGTVLLSAVIGLRKPDPRMYEKACADMRRAPAECVSVADNLNRDFTGAKGANIGMNVMFTDNLEKLRTDRAKGKVKPENRPDCVITDFAELLDIFPEAPLVNFSAMRQIEDV